MESSKTTEITEISEIKELVTSHIQENRLRRETYLELLQELDKNLDAVNKQLDKITKNEAAVAKEQEPIYSLREHDIIDLSFLPLSNVDDLDDLEEKLSADYDYKQNMIETICQFGDIQKDAEQETRKFMEILFTSEMLYDFTYDEVNRTKIRFKEYQHVIEVLYYIVLRNFDKFTIENTVGIVKDYLKEVTLKRDRGFSP